MFQEDILGKREADNTNACSTVVLKVDDHGQKCV
jgi:hypothetical protein